MANRYFVQYLLNIGALSSKEVLELLPKLKAVKPEQDVLTLTGEQAKAVPDSDVCFAQLLLDEGRLDIKGLEEHLANYAKAEEQVNPVVEAVLNRADNPEDKAGLEEFGKYVEMFIMSLHRFMDTEAVILPESPEPVDKQGWLVSQSLNGGVVLTAGIKADTEIFLELGRRFSGEELTEIDDLAIDCIAEFLNVLNGLYIVNLSQLDMDVDLGEPHSAEDGIPEAMNMHVFTVATEFGSFVLYIAESEFLVM